MWLMPILSVGAWTGTAVVVWTSVAWQLWQEENDHSLAELAREENTKGLYRPKSSLKY